MAFIQTSAFAEWLDVPHSYKKKDKHKIENYHPINTVKHRPTKIYTKALSIKLAGGSTIMQYTQTKPVLLCQAKVYLNQVKLARNDDQLRRGNRKEWVSL